jgi:uncharacterized membrane protein
MSATTSHLVAISFDDEYKADEARVALRRMQGDGLIDVAETATVVVNVDGKQRLSQDTDLTVTRRTQGHWIGIAAAFATGTMPFILAGTIAGTVVGKLTDHGITDGVMKKIGHTLTPCTSALFILVRESAHPEAVVERLRPLGGKVAFTTLTPEAEKALTEAFEGETA